MRYAAFLRAINVGGRNLVKMDVLRRLFLSLGFRDVQTYIQSGNVMFGSSGNEPEALVKRIEKELHKFLTKDVRTVLRTMRELEQMVERNPFREVNDSSDLKRYVSFLSEKLRKKPALPLLSQHQDLEVFRIEGTNVFTVSRPYKGRFDYPTNFLEEMLNVQATTRNWDTIKKMLGTTIRPGIRREP